MNAVDPTAVTNRPAALLARRLASGVLRKASLLPPVATPMASDTREVAQLLRSEYFQHQVCQQAEHLDMSREEALAEAGGYLRELSAWHHPRVSEPWRRLSGWMTRGYDVLVDADALAGLRREDREHPLIFLISHRSYLDEFVLPPALITGGLSPSYGLAGANLNFFPLGTVARRTGIVHVRRATANAPIYRLALRSFIGQLVANKANLIWSIEGGRSRTGKLRPPRYGLLRYVADAVDAAHRRDGTDGADGLDSMQPLLVPTSIMYDQLPMHEVDLMTLEAKGAGKQPEDLRWLINYASGLRKRLGRVYLDFGDPLPLCQRLAELRGQDVAQEHLVERVALELCHRINKASPVTPTAAVCVALLGSDRSLTLDQVLASVRPLADYLSRRGLAVAGGANLTDRSTVRWALRGLVHSGVLSSYSGGSETVWGIGARQHLIAAVYRNSAIHVFVVRAIAERALLAVADTENEEGEQKDASARCALLEEALRLRELLKFDFFFSPRAKFTDEVRAEVAILASPDILTGLAVTPEQAQQWLARAHPLVAHLMLRPFLQAYQLVGDQLAALEEDEPVDRESLMRRCLQVGHQWALQRTLASEESVTTAMFATALNLAAHRDLLTSDLPHLGKRRRAFADELREVALATSRIADRAVTT